MNRRELVALAAHLLLVAIAANLNYAPARKLFARLQVAAGGHGRGLQAGLSY